MKLQFYLMSNIPLTNTSNLSTYRNNMHFTHTHTHIYIYIYRVSQEERT